MTLPDFIETTIYPNEQFQNSSIGGAQFEGKAGYHAFYSHDDAEDNVAAAFHVAFHAAVQEAYEELFIDTEIVEGEYGEVTPETVTQAFIDQSEESVRFPNSRIADRLDQKLRELSDFSDHGEGDE